MTNTQVNKSEALPNAQTSLAHGKKGKAKHQSLFSKLLTTLQHHQNKKVNTTASKTIEVVNEETTKTAHTKNKNSLKQSNIIATNKAVSTNKTLTTVTDDATVSDTPKNTKNQKESNDGSEMVAVNQESPFTIQKANTVLEVLTPKLSQQTGETKNAPNDSSPPLSKEGTLRLGMQLNQTPQEDSKEHINANPSVLSVRKKQVPVTAQPQLKHTTLAQAKGIPSTGSSHIEGSELEYESVTDKSKPNLRSESMNIKEIFIPNNTLGGISTKKNLPSEGMKTKVDTFIARDTPSHTQVAAIKLSKGQPISQRQPISQGQDLTTPSPIQGPNSIKTTESSNSNMQQDFTSNQQEITPSFVENNKTEIRNKGIDFQAQLAYRTQQTFTPADTMLEIVKSAKDGSTSLELQLEPAHLGKVHVSIQMDAAKQIQVAFTVDQNTSRQVLEQHMPQLRLALAQQGLDLGGFSMQMNQQQTQQEHQPSSQQKYSATEVWEGSTQDATQEIKIGINLAENGRLSILA